MSGRWLSMQSWLSTVSLLKPNSFSSCTRNVMSPRAALTIARAFAHYFREDYEASAHVALHSGRGNRPGTL